MTSHYPYDPGAFERTWRRLLELVPEYYRALDQGAGGADLERLVRALAAPLAVVRQSIDELHADLFVDSARDAVIPLLAEMVGTALVFPDAASNRRDVRGTVARRKRKGTVQTLEDLGADLSARMTPVTEGWKRLALTQDLDLLRLGRTIADLRDIRLAEANRGPLDRAYHAADVRAPSATSGRYHPRHVAHWLHVTEMFEAIHAEVAYVGNHGDARETTDPTGTDPDWRYAVHPLGRYQPLRADRVSADDELATDRIPPMHFAAEPGAYFARDRRFTVEIHGLAAAIAAPDREGIEPSLLVARRALLDGDIGFELLDRPSRRSSDAVRLSVVAAPVVAGTMLPDVGASAVVRRSIVIQPTTLGAPSAPGPALPASWQGAALLRLEPVGSAVGFFAGATVAITGGTDAARRGHASLIDPTLYRRGQLQGAVVVEIPPMWVFTTRWLYLGADGTLGEVQTGGQGVPAVPLFADAAAGAYRMDRRRLVAIGPGPAWPPLPLTADGERTPWIVPARRGPVLMHGGTIVAESGGATVPPPANARASIVFLGAVTAMDTTYQPVGELVVRSPVAADVGRWIVLDQDGDAAADPQARLAAIAAWVDAQAEDAVRLVARLESDTANLVFTPGEVVWIGAAGHSLLVHLPELIASATTPGEPRPHRSLPVEVAVDGSTWESEGSVARMATGGTRDAGTWRGVAPLAAPVMHRRRRVRWASLCPWRNEATEGRTLEVDRIGFLDVDVEHGLFAFGRSEAAQLAPPRSPRRAPNVTATYLEGATRHVGARHAERAPVLGRVPDPPTRIVSCTGAVGAIDVAGRLAVPQYLSLTAALQAIADDAERAAVEVIEIADSGVYSGETPVWPASATGEAVTRELIIRAAEGARPVLVLASWTTEPGAGFERVVLHGLMISTVVPPPPTEPPVVVLAPPLRDPVPALGGRSRAELDIELCTFVEKVRVHAATPPQGLRVRVLRAITSALEVTGSGDLVVEASIIDPGTVTATALRASEGEVTVERCTVMGQTEVKVLEASESIFVGPVTVSDRFHGCIRFSRATVDSVLPRRHRVIPEPAVETGGVAADVPVRFVSIDRHDAAYARLAESCDPRIRFGAADGAEMGAYHDDLWSVRREALLRRLTEHTPAGLVTGLIRMD